ncbi:acyltransferase, WS/DGAT/MGAT [Tistlia consotensis]|uniref:diacylglycerol O-acyltransferase n=1 Tax=Tistlia consotensis USBA 355 TaxID=560819 RepID=A0A1Y6CSK9_9PROT|nr:wax ester/triacylglycerol synthase domain-containing protein [Tistlia consotensis]SMF73532.1 acyltransferase, WS/DGAT/MGAT [Tistlia consotensis USBA 355]SNS30112.1 acyltransferase, WS/DGAT/MGAT [Tistlia consotensis]
MSEAFERLPRVGRFFLTRPRDDRHGCLVLILAADGDGRPLDLEALRAQVGSRVGLLPSRFRRRLADCPFGLAPPILVDDPAFSVERHVERLEIGAPEGQAGDGWDAFDAALCRFVREPLDQSRPLWRMVVAEGLPGGRSAVVVKLHHAITEGEGALASIGNLLFRNDPAPEQATGGTPAPEPGRLRWIGLALGHAAGRSRAGLAALARGIGAWRDPAAEVARWRATRAACRRQLGGRRAASPLRAPVGPRNAIAVAVCALETVQRIRAAQADPLTFDAVVLAAIAGGLRRWFQERGLEPREQVVQVPVSVARRGLGVTKDFVEMPSLMVVPLPVGEADPAERLRRLGRITAERAADAPALQNLFGLLTLLPMPLYRRAAGRLYDKAPHFHLASLRGPAATLRVRGNPVELAYIPTPVRGELALRFAVLTLGGTLTVTLSCDPDVVVAPERLARHIEGALAELAGPEAESSPSTTPGPSGSVLAADRPLASNQEKPRPA